MSKLGSWSTTPGNNNATPPDGWPEGQAPSTVNDCAREMMASIKTYAQDAQFFDHNITPSFLSVTSFSLATADVTNFHVGRRIKLYDNSTLYGTIDSVSATYVSVRLDSGALTVSLSSVALATLANNNNALPQSVFRRNMIINGGMDIWQRGDSFGPANNTSTFTADRFVWLQSSTAAMKITRTSLSDSAGAVPTLAQAGIRYNNSILISVSAADAAIGAAEYALLSYRMEGYDWRQIAHKPMSLGFWVHTNRSGFYNVSIRNSPVSVSYVSTYTVSTGAINTWTHFSINIAKAPADVATWSYTHSLGAEIAFCFAAGTDYHAAAGSWSTGNLIATSNQENFLSATTNVFRITGVELKEGFDVTPAEPVHYSENLARCQRYYWRGLPAQALNFAAYTAAAIMTWPVKFSASMRITPTVALSVPGITTSGLQSNPSVSQPTKDGCRLLATAAAAAVNANFTFGAADYIEASAEL